MMWVERMLRAKALRIFIMAQDREEGIRLEREMSSNNSMQRVPLKLAWEVYITK